MRGDKREWPDWRDAAAYTPLLDADRSLFAWEWLRRDSRYRASAEAAAANGSGAAGGPAPGDFGLVAFEPAGLPVPFARPLWSSRFHSLVLQAQIGQATAAQDAFAVEALGRFASVVQSVDADHLLLSDGLRSVRLDAPPGTLADAPVCLEYRIHGRASAEPAVLALRRFLALCLTGDFSRSLHPREIRARRWILALRTHDALAAGAGHRQIAEELLGASVDGPGWRSREPSIRSQAQRLARNAAACSAGGFLSLLR